MEQDIIISDSVKINKGKKIKSSIIIFILLSFLVYFFLKDTLFKFFIFELVLVVFLIKNYYSKDESTDEVKQEVPNVKKISKKIMYGILFVLIINILIYFSTKNISGIFILNFIALFSFLVYLSYRNKKENETLMKEIATELQCSYSKDADLTSFSGLLFNIGNSRKIENVFSGNFNGSQFRIFDFSFKTGIGKNSTPFGFTFFELLVGSKLPNMVISSKAEAYTSIEQIKKEIIKESEVVTLEGNFSNFFSTIVENGKQMEVRQILTPDIMVFLIDKTPNYSFIFTDNKLYICFKNFYSGSDAAGSFSKDDFLKNIEESKYLSTKWLPSLIRMN